MAGLVAQNFGIAVMPEIPILRQLEVDILSIRNQHEKRFVYMAWGKDAYQAPRVPRFFEYVRGGGLWGTAPGACRLGGGEARRSLLSGKTSSSCVRYVSLLSL